MYRKVAPRRRVDREAYWFRRLRGFRGIPRFMGVATMKSWPIGQKELRMERMRESWLDSTGVSRSNDDTMNPVADLATFWDQAFQLAMILDLMHRRYRCAHRDVKPDNVCIDRDGFLRLIDLEMCVAIPGPGHVLRPWRFADNEWRSFRGTHMYAPPEMLLPTGDVRRLNDDTLFYDERCDCWSYAVTLLEAYSGADFNSTVMVRRSQRAVNDRIERLIALRAPNRLLRSLLRDCLRLRCRDRCFMADVVYRIERSGYIRDDRVEMLRKRLNYS